MDFVSGEVTAEGATEADTGSSGGGETTRKGVANHRFRAEDGRTGTVLNTNGAVITGLQIKCAL